MKAASISSAEPALKTSICCPSARAVACASLVSAPARRPVGFTSSPIVVALGTSSVNNSIRLAIRSLVNMLIPVMLPPGRLRLPTRPAPTEIAGGHHNDRNSGCPGFGWGGRTVAERSNYGDTPTHQIGQQRRQSFVVIFRPAIFDCDTASFNVASGIEALAECSRQRCKGTRRAGVKEPDHRHRRLLRARRERPRRRRAAEQRDELAALHSTTSSARADKSGGTSIPICLAVFRFITNSNLLDCMTGKSAGLSPLRIRAT